uniref:THAP-type domain-containing protein n=1 Tax=Magallana gigas TaxID=29159 RepID=A0A8W8LPB4_MAGGI
MPACQALNCRNKQGQCKKSFFVIPNPAKDDASKQRCKQWLTNLRNRKLRFENYVFNARKLVCEDHFTPDCFDRNPVAESLNFLPRCKKLKPDAVPTLIDTATNKMKAEGSVKNVRVKLSNNKLKLKKNRAKTKDDLLASRRGIGKPRASATVTMVTKHSHPECNSTNQLEHGREDTSFISQNNPVSTSVTVKEKVECDEMVPCRVCGHPCSVCLKSEYPRPSQFPPDHYGYCRKTRTIGTMTEATDNGIMEHGDIVVTSVKKISHTLHKEVRSNINESHGKRNPVNGNEKHLFDSHDDDANENDDDNDEVSSLLQIKKFIVFESCIDDILNCLTCNICKCPIERSSTIKEYRGSMIMVSVFCPDGHLVKQWSSQPLRGEIPVVDLLVSAAIPFAGQSYTQISQFANFMNLQIQSEKAYETVQREIVLPVVDHSWNVMQDHIFRKIKDSNCFLSFEGEIVTCAGCSHENLSPKEAREKKWLKRGSKAHNALKEVVQDKSLLKDIGNLSEYCNISNLDVYHRVLTKYVPKRQDFDLDHMNCRTAIAIIDHNMSQNRDKKVDMHGIGVYKTEFSKVVPNMEAKPVNNSKLYKWVAVLMKLCLLQSQTMAIPIETVTARSKGNIASVQPQKKADIVSKLRSRFKVVYDQMP